MDIWVKPGAKRSGVLGFRDDGVQVISVTAPATEGKANAAVCKVIADWLDVPASWVSVQSGHQSRQKRICIQLPDNVERANAICHQCQSV